MHVIESKSILDDVDSDAAAVQASNIEFQNVTFKYPHLQEKPVLKDFSEVFEVNKSTAIFGEGDADTSIITKLIERFYDPQ